MAKSLKKIIDSGCIITVCRFETGQTEEEKGLAEKKQGLWQKSLANLKNHCIVFLMFIWGIFLMMEDIHIL